MAVEHTAAGADVVCQCGRRVPIPSLAKLRTEAGLSAVEESTEKAIVRLIKEGVLPNSDCLCCGNLNATEYSLVAECERGASKTSGGFDWGLFLATLAMPITFFSWSRTVVESQGRITIVPVPISLCIGCRTELPRIGLLWALKIFNYVLLGLGVLSLIAFREYLSIVLPMIIFIWMIQVFFKRRSQSKYSALLRKVDMYRKLLEEYDGATIEAGGA